MNIQKTVRSLVLAALVSIGVVAPSQAALISVVPAAQAAHPGDAVAVDVVLSGLAAPIGGFSFDLFFNPAVLTPNDAGSNVNAAALGAGALDTSNRFGANFFDVFVSAAQNAAPNNATGFTLAHIAFVGGPGLGNSPLTLSPLAGAFLTDFAGTAPVSTGINNGLVCVFAAGTTGPCAIPEPGSLALIALGGVALGAIRRRRGA